MPREIGAVVGMSDGDRLTAHQERDLVIAAEGGDADACTRLVAYASFWVRKAMQELVADLTRPVALSDRAVRALAQLRAARREHLEAHGREPTGEELSRATGFTLAQLEALEATERLPRGLEERLSTAGRATGTIADSIADPVAEREYEDVLDTIEIGEVRELADRLDERERAIIRAHYGLGGPPQTLSQIGGSLGLTAERARQIEVAALAKLRGALVQSPHPRGRLASP